MSKRHYDDNEGGFSRKRRRISSAPTPDPNEIEDRLESLISRVGEKSTSSLESNLEGLAGVLEADISNYKQKILKILCQCVLLLPEKVTVYTTLVGLLNGKNYTFGGEFVENIYRQLRECMKSCEWQKAELIVRFLADLVNCHVIDVSSILALFESFVTVTLEDGVPQVRQDWFIFAVLSSLPWIGHEIFVKKEKELEKLLSNIGTYIGKRKKDHLSFLQVWTSDTPHPQEDYLDCLWAQISKLHGDKWVERTLLRPYLAFDGQLSEALQHSIPPINPPPHNQESTYPIPRVIFRMFDYTDSAAGAPEQGPIMPGHHSIERYIIEDYLHKIIKSHYKDRKECASQLVSYHGKNKIPLNYMIVEVILAQLFELPASPKLEMFYAVLLIELCKLQPSSLPQVLAQASDILFERLDTMNTSCMDRFATWFALHLSNFQFRWSWDDWGEVCNMNPFLPKSKFVREVLVKCLRLSYHQRVVESVPSTFAELLPDKPAPIYKYKAEGAGSLPGTIAAHKLQQAIKSKATAEEVLSILKDLPSHQSDADDESAMEGGDASFSPLQIDVFVLTLLHLGSKSFSHSFSGINKFNLVFKSLAGSEESQICILQKVQEIWLNHQQMIVVLVDKLLKVHIITCAAVANWIFSSEMSTDFTRSYIWEVLHSTIRKMNKHVKRAEDELQDARERFDKNDGKKKNDSDNEDDDNEPPTEDQVDRLLEYMEEAQNDQKRLFLIIFQRFIMLLTEHLVRCENEQKDFNTPWYRYTIERLQELLLVHRQQVKKYQTTLETLLFTSDIDSHIYCVYQQFCALSS